MALFNTRTSTPLRFNARLSAALPPTGTPSPTSSATRLWGGSSQSPFMRRTQGASWNQVRPTLGQPPGSRPGGMLADVRTPPPTAQPPAGGGQLKVGLNEDGSPIYGTPGGPVDIAFNVSRDQPPKSAQPPTGGMLRGTPPAPVVAPVTGGGTEKLKPEQSNPYSMFDPMALRPTPLPGATTPPVQQPPVSPPSPTPTTAAGGAGNPVPESWLDQIRRNTTGYINTTLGNQGGAYSPEVMESMRDQIAKRMRASALSAAGNQGTLGSSVLARNMSQEVGDALARLEMENQSQGLAARQNAAQLGQGMFFGGTGDLMRQQELGGNLQSQNLNDYLRWQQLQNEMYWKPKEFAYNVALNDAMRQAGADAGQSALYGKLLESGMGMLGYANAPQYQYNPIATA